MRVVVVGAGVIGLSTAYHLAKGGADVQVLDRSHPGAGASTRNAGWVVPTMSEPVTSPAALRSGLRWMWRPDSPLKIGMPRGWSQARFLLQLAANSRSAPFQAGLRATAELNRRTRDSYAALEADGVAFEHHRRGLLYAFTRDSTIQAHLDELAYLEGFGNPAARLLTGDEARELEPALSSAVVAGIECAGESNVDPASLVSGLASSCRALGVRFADNETVHDLQRQGGRVTGVCGSRVWPADQVVLAAGVWSANALSAAGLRLPVQAGKGYGYDFTPAWTDLGRSIYLSDHKVAISQLHAGIRVCGTMELGNHEPTVDRRRGQAILSATRLCLTGVPEQNPIGWAGLRPMTPDGLPIIGRLSSRPEVTIATGHAMLGVTLAPVTGELVAQSVLTGSDPAVLMPFRPERFGSVARRHRAGASS